MMCISSASSLSTRTRTWSSFRFGCKYSTATVVNSPRCAPIPNRRVLSITGAEPQLSTFLNGILSTNVKPGQPGGFFSSFLSPQGRIFYDVFFHPHPSLPPNSSGYIIDFDPHPVPPTVSPTHPHPPLPALLKRYILRSKVRVADVSEEWDVWGSWGAAEDGQEQRRGEILWKWGRSGAVEPHWNRNDGVGFGFADELKGEYGLWDWRAPGMGKRFLAQKGRTPSTATDHDLVEPSEFTRHRILNGVPEGADDLADMLPMDGNLDLMGGVDFHKGCYVGQELTVRTYHTGIVRKRVVPVTLSAPSSSSLSPPPLHALIRPLTSSSPFPSSASPRRTRTPRGGRLLSRVGTDALALIRLDQLEAFEKGEMTFVIGEEERGGWDVRPKRPEWWPVRGDTSGT